MINAQVTVTGSTSADGNYTRLALAFTAINSASQSGNNIVLTITSSTTETAIATLNAGSWTSLKIYPVTSGLSISGNLATPLINLNGASNVTIDGRVNATGSSKDLVISNSSTSNTSGTSTIRFINTGQLNNVQFCTIKGSSLTTTGGIIYFATSASGTGNSNNTIDNCNITNDGGNRPINALYSLGSTGFINTSNTVSNNYIYDFLNPGASSNGISISSFSTAFTISDNSFYEVSNPLTATAANTYSIINVNNTSGVNFNISNNSIGGSAPFCGSLAFTINGNFAHIFQGIYMNIGTTTPSSIQNNILKNINLTTTSATPWYGFYINAGAVNIGNTTGNTIGETTGNGNITLTNTTSNATSYGIYINSTGTIVIQNNSIGSITTIGSSSISHSINAILKMSVTGTWSVSNNSIGSASTLKSIQASTSALTSTVGQEVYGVHSFCSGTTIITGNTIVNVHNAYTGGLTTSRTRGIDITNGANSVQNNTIRNLSTTSGQQFFNLSCSITGISVNIPGGSGAQTIKGNTIYNLTNTHSSAKVDVYGIYFSGTLTGTNIISDNFIYGLSLSTSNTTGKIEGILIYRGISTVYNNIINFGGEITSGNLFYGIFDQCDVGNNSSIFFNTVYIGGTISSLVTTSSTFALYSNANTSSRDYRNNILYNARSGGKTGIHYSIYLAGSTSLTIDYNDYYVSAGGKLGRIVATDYNILDASWKTASGGDNNSINTNPGLMIAGSTTTADYMPSVTLTGLTGLGITIDILGVSRTSSPTLGAVERGPFWMGSTSTDYNTASNWSNNMVPSSGINIFFADNPDRSCYLDADRIVRAIIINQSTDKLVLNGHKLTINGTLVLYNTGQIDASANNSTVEFAGPYSQPVPSGAFYNNEIYNLIINNANNITLNGTLRLSNTLTALSGRLDATTNSPTIVFSGNNPQTIETACFLNDLFYNLTIDNGTSVTMNSIFTINNNLLINTGKIFKIAPGIRLNISGAITNSAGNAGFILQSDASGTATLIHNTNSVPATVQRYINGDAWHFLSTPVTGGAISGDWLPTGTYGNGTGYDLYAWNESSSCWIYKTDISSTINWNTIHPGNDFISGKGYLYSVQESSAVKEFAGNLTNGTVNYGLTFSSADANLKGFNLVGNPYPSTIDWRAAAGWTRTNQISSGGGYNMWIWNPSANNYGVYNSADADGTGTNSVSRIIAPMQGYFVQASGSGNLSMNNAIRVTDNTGWLKKSTEEETYKLNLIVKSESGYGSDEIQLHFGFPVNENGAAKLFSRSLIAPGLFMFSEGKSFSVSYFTNPEDNPSIPVMFEAGVTGKYTISCNFDPNKYETVMLEDKLLHYIQNMKSKGSYSFEANKSDGSDRFVLHFGPEKDPKDRAELPARVFSMGNELIVDLTLVGMESEIYIYDLMGRLILHKILQAEIEHNLRINTNSKILLVYLKNSVGSLSRKILWSAN
jgi:hypothetical protein